jgi:[ribosomal protein S18]-alanine N-acetyltransferase
VDPLTIRPFAADESAEVALWTYDPPFDLYNSDPGSARLFLEIDADGFGFYALADAADDVVGFCCFGAEARVPPQTPEEGTVDLGGGIRPDRLSEGVATATLPAVMAFALRWNPRKFRIAVAAFNDRSICLCQSAGFELTGSFSNKDGRDLLELGRVANRI